MLFLLFLLTGCFRQNEPEVSRSRAELALEVAKEQIGAPYRWGGRRPPEFDCSGLITWSYKQAVGDDEIFYINDHLTDDATMQDLYEYNVDLIPYEKVKPGDIVFITRESNFITHGGLFIEWVVKYQTFKMVHATSAQEEVVVEEWNTGELKRNQWLEGIGRLKIIE